MKKVINKVSYNVSIWGGWTRRQTQEEGEVNREPERRVVRGWEDQNRVEIVKDWNAGYQGNGVKPYWQL